MMVNTLCGLTGDTYLVKLSSTFEGIHNLNWHGCIQAESAFWALELGGFRKVARRLQEDTTAEEALTISAALLNTADAIKASGAEERAGDVRALARWYEIASRLGCGVKSIETDQLEERMLLEMNP